MAEYPIIMKQKNNQGNYDTLYPKTLGSQVQGMTLDQVSGNLDSSRIEGNIPSSQIEGTFPSSSITGQFPASQINDIYTKDQTLTQAIAQLFNLSSGSAVPNDVFNVLSKAALLNSGNDGLVLPNGQTITLPNTATESGNRMGTDTLSYTISFSSRPNLLIIGTEINTGFGLIFPKGNFGFSIFSDGWYTLTVGGTGGNVKISVGSSLNSTIVFNDNNKKYYYSAIL